MINYQTITIDLQPDYREPVVQMYLSERDVGRPIQVNVLMQGQPYSFIAGTTVHIDLRKPSGHVVQVNGNYAVGSNVVLFNVVEQMAAEPGMCLTELSIVGDGQDPIGSKNWLTKVELSPMHAGDPSETWIEDLDKLVQDAMEGHIDATLSIPGDAADAAAVGEELADLKSAIGDIVETTTETVTEHKSADGFTAMDGYVIGSDGAPSASANYITFYKTFNENADIWFTSDDKTHYSAFLAISTKTGDTYTARKRYIENSEDALPTSSSPLSIATGAVLYICCYKAAYTTYGYPTFYWSYTTETETLNPNLRLADAHIEQVGNALGIKNCKVQYKSDLSSESATEGLYIYIPTKTGYIRQQFVHSIDNAKNANCWRMGHVYACDNDLVAGAQLTTDGEWECAVRLSGKSDSSGGIAHGDEVGTDIIVFVDGKVVAPSDLSTLTEFDELRIVTYSNLYDPNPSNGIETIIAVHGCERVYSKNGIVVNQTLTWSIAVTATSCYLAMFPVSKTVTNKYFTDMHYGVQDIPSDHSQRTSVGARAATIYSAPTGFTGEFNTPVYPTGYANGDYFLMLDNGGNAYNKCYYCITNSSGSVTYEIPSGTVWKSKTEYKIDVVN